MKAYVIFMNDSAEFVVLKDKKKAEKKLEELAKAHFETDAVKWNFPGYRDYRKKCYWHLHDAEAI